MNKFMFLCMIVLLGLYIVNCGSDRKEGGDSSDSTRVAQEHSESAKVSGAGAGNPKNGKSVGSGEASAVPIEVTQLTVGNIDSSLFYSSTLETEQLVDVYSRIGGLIEKIYVDESDQVRKGEPLIRIEQEQYVLAEQNAKLEYRKQRANFNRLKALQEKDLLSKEKFENSRWSMEQARISWKQAQLNLKHTTVTAPISGVVGDRQVRMGARVQPSTKLLSIANLDEKIIKVFVPQNEFTHCYKDQPAIITSEVVPNMRFSGHVKRISPMIDPKSGTFKVTVALKDSENKLHPGMFVNARLIVDMHENTRLIPKAAIVYENERSYFFVVDSDSVQKVALKKGFEDAEKVEILNPFPKTTKVVVVGQSGLKNGSRVKVVEEKKYVWQKISQRKTAP